jgi:hypothetical protein
MFGVCINLEAGCKVRLLWLRMPPLATGAVSQLSHPKSPTVLPGLENKKPESSAGGD